MLAATLDSELLTESLFSRGPLLVQPKYDGIRCQVENGQIYSGRNGKLLPNEHVQSFARHLLGRMHLDGEMMVKRAYGSSYFCEFADSVLPNGAKLRGVESQLMSREGHPEFCYVVFDDLSYPTASYTARFAKAKQQVDSILRDASGHIQLIASRAVYNVSEYTKWEEHYCLLGHEGACARLATGHYKEGRSTLNERLLLKHKRFEDDEAYVVMVEPLYTNTNEAITNETTGLLERSSHQAGLEQQETMGALVCHSAKFTESFKVGTGFDKVLREYIWQNRHSIVGQKITYKYQPHGTKDRPRSPVFRRFRNSD